MAPALCFVFMSPYLEVCSLSCVRASSSCCPAVGWKQAQGSVVLRAHPFNPLSVGPTHPRRVISAQRDVHGSWKPLWEQSGVRKGEIGISFQPGPSVSFVWHRGRRKVVLSPCFVTRYKSSVGFLWAGRVGALLYMGRRWREVVQHHTSVFCESGQHKGLGYGTRHHTNSSRDK